MASDTFYSLFTWSCKLPSLKISIEVKELKVIYFGHRFFCILLFIIVYIVSDLFNVNYIVENSEEDGVF